MLKKFSAVLIVSFAFTLGWLAAGVLVPPLDGAAVASAETDGASGADESGQSDGTAAPAQKETKVLSLEEALQLASENNSNLKSARIDLEQAYITASQGSEASRGISEAESLSAANIKYVQSEKTALNKKIAKQKMEVVEEQVKLLIKQYYYAVLQARDIVEVSQSSLERAQKELENAEIAFEVGTVAKTDVLSAQMGVANAQAQLTADKNDYQLAVIDLNSAIGLPLDTPLELTTKVEYKAPEVVDLAKTIEEAKKTRLDVASAEAAKLVAEKQYEIDKKYTSTGTFTTKLAALDITSAELEIENTYNEVVSDITKAYLNVQAADDTVKYMNAAVEQAQENFRLTSLRYQVGMATMLDVLDASVQLADMQAKQVKALYSFDLAKLSLETAKLAPLSM